MGRLYLDMVMCKKSKYMYMEEIDTYRNADVLLFHVIEALLSSHCCLV